MKHNLCIDGYLYRLRPASTEDAPFVVEVRTENAERNKFIHPISQSVDAQIQWLENYYKTDGDYYFVIENLFTKEPEGLISIYNIRDKKGESGRWVIKEDSLAAIESFYLLYRLAFEQILLDEVYSTVIEENKPVIAFHKSAGQKIRGILPGYYLWNGAQYNAIEFYMEKDYFQKEVCPNLERKARRLFELFKKRNQGYTN
ncbi:MAG: GNAT family N-acetyltransferase [Bacteroidales bacterium]|jgi:RimJ/RimL family protein N-acetyltransferase|nr:GNAT family N-acetyltransferase [Bacteroidales bacterium]